MSKIWKQCSSFYLQWLSQKPNTTIFMGCIGKDKFGEILNEKASAVGVSAHYQYDEKEATGTAACIITGSSRFVSLQFVVTWDCKNNFKQRKF